MGVGVRYRYCNDGGRPVASVFAAARSAQPHRICGSRRVGSRRLDFRLREDVRGSLDAVYREPCADVSGGFDETNRFSTQRTG
jgi:hypothetical protein